MSFALNMISRYIYKCKIKNSQNILKWFGLRQCPWSRGHKSLRDDKRENIFRCVCGSTVRSKGWKQEENEKEEEEKIEGVDLNVQVGGRDTKRKWAKGWGWRRKEEEDSYGVRWNGLGRSKLCARSLSRYTQGLLLYYVYICPFPGNLTQWTFQR